jgi:arylsulfatase A-like enzyme
VEPRAAVPGSRDRPNVVLIVTDDQDTMSLAHMPRVRALLGEGGMTFARSYVTTPVCCPSRATLLRGQYAHNHGVLQNAGVEGGVRRFRALNLEQSTVATWLDAAGYRTAFFGKYLNGYSGDAIPPGWNTWFAFVEPLRYFDYVVSDNGRRVFYGGAEQDYSTDVLADRVARHILASAGDSTPLFLYIATWAPHEYPVPARRHRGLFAGARAPRSPNFNEADVSDKPPAIRNRPLLDPATIADLDVFYQEYLGSLLAVDELVSAVVDALAAIGALDHTYVVFTSDNGLHVGQHRGRNGKGNPYEEDIRVPLLVRGPGIIPGIVNHNLVLNVDLAPTIAEIAGVEAPSFVDGQSLLPLLRTGGMVGGAWRRQFLVEYWVFNADSTARLQWEAAHRGDSVFVRWTDGFRELYDLLGDPFQLDNAAPVSASGVLAEFELARQSLRSCRGTSCRQAGVSVAPRGARLAGWRR